MDWGKFLFSFNGRISRKAFWIFLLVMIAIQVVIAFLSPAPVVDPANTDPMAAMTAAYAATPWWSWLLSVLFLYIGLAVYAKRWHDQDRSGWWNLLLLLTPLLFIGPLILIIMCGFIAGTPGPNRFGEAPMA
ncbi:DUF805 domain-containing protein [Chiayiivirga flava]|uniref:Uncharacterized membrane protein YhaH (DUF805 family) n=1 Tax=Chiayiivirga flava TaxID=659595 RepID=A0A7W8D7P0_9GAMM|nr:DUF805 domain-containing protein [Chiayiivirga flava]MBB5208290.1 uncharacterized membrane protein YhaH (DUF805 family) [Chiayiivirga flava]